MADKKTNKKKRISIVLAAALLMTGLTGCAENQIPDLGKEEVQAVGEFVALTMMKYDIDHRSRLMDLTELEEASMSENPLTTPEPEEASGMAPVDDTPIVNSPGKEETVRNEYTMEEVLGLPEGLSITFEKQEVCDNYPEAEDFFSLNASAGKKLLVLHFSLANTGSQEQRVDIFALGASFNVTVNGDYSRRALVTMLLNDLSTYTGTVSAGDHVETVLVIEVDEGMEGNISSASLHVKFDEKTCVLNLL